MPRDDDYMRSLMLELEGADYSGFLIPRNISMNDEQKKQAYHLKLLHDKGFVAFEGHVARLTNAGHDFTNAVRDEGIWKKTREAIIRTGGNATIEIVMALAVGFLKEKISKHTGIEL